MATPSAAPVAGRRHLHRVLAAGLLACAGVHARAAAPLGLVLPRQPAPELTVTGIDGQASTLAARLRGHVTAVQLVFTGCAGTCPVQGAVFAAVAQRVGSADLRLLSLTVDPLGDGPAQLRSWLDRFGRHARWTAAAPRVEDVDRLGAALRGEPPGAGTHSSQVFLFDRQARLAFRTVHQPTAEHVADLLKQLAAA